MGPLGCRLDAPSAAHVPDTEWSVALHDSRRQPRWRTAAVGRNESPRRSHGAITLGARSGARYGLVASALLVAALSCRRTADPSLDLMHSVGACDTTPMKPYGRVVEIPNAHRRTDFGVLTGVVVQDETGDALEGAVVDLRIISNPTDSARIWRYTNSKGGFSFDSLAPGVYRLRVRRIGEASDTATIRSSADRVDTLTLRMHAYRCFGY
jgi:hypothetical protein